MDYGRKKVLIRGRASYCSDYCDMHDRGIYEGRNLNRPVINKFTRDEINFLVFHNCLKHGKSRIVLQYDLVKRRSKPTCETRQIKPNEILDNLMKIENTQKYLFLKYENDDFVKLICYDYKTDKRQIIGRIESNYDLSDIRNTKIIHQLIYPNSMPANLKQKLNQILHRFDTKLYRSVCYYAKIYKGSKSPNSEN